MRVARRRSTARARPSRGARRRAARARAAGTMSCSISGSARIWPTVMRGLSDANGSWKISCTLRRKGRKAVSLKAVTSSPSRTHAAGGRLDQPHARAARPSTCRSRTRRRAPASRRARSAKDTPSTAFTVASGRPSAERFATKCFTRSSTASTYWLTPPSLRAGASAIGRAGRGTARMRGLRLARRPVRGGAKPLARLTPARLSPEGREVESERRERCMRITPPASPAARASSARGGRRRPRRAAASRRSFGMRNGQRAWKRQPGGGAVMFGTVPSIAARRGRRRSSRGKRAEEPDRVGMLRKAGTASSTLGAARRPGRHTSRRPRRRLRRRRRDRG